MPGPVTLAACLLDLVESLYGRLVANYGRLAATESDAGLRDYYKALESETMAEWEEFRDEWKPRLDRIIATRGRS